MVLHRVGALLSLLCFLVATLVPSTSAQSVRSDFPRRERRPSPIASTIFLGDWYDHYNRAIRRLNSGDRKGAEADLRVAIRLHPEDDPRARTYGVRFQECYANLELGIILYETGRYSEALSRLKASLAVAPLDETRFFIHETQRQIVLETGSDSALPQLTITEPVSGMVTNKTSIVVRGKASDDYYVDTVSVNNEAVDIPPARPGVEFEWETQLSDGVNRIETTATDLAGRSQSVEIEVLVDRQGPVFSLKKAELLSGGNRARLVGDVYDRHEVGSVAINGRPLATGNRQLVSVDMEVPLPAESKSIRILAVDGFANRTVADIDPRVKVGAAPAKKGRIQVAAIGFDPRWLVSAVDPGPRIDLLDLRSGQRVFLDRLYIDGRVSDADGVDSVRFNGSLVDIIPRGTELYFGHVAGPLENGTNTVEIKAADIEKQETTQLLHLECVRPTNLPIEQRLAIAVPSFDSVREDANQVFLQEVHNVVTTAIADRGRFFYVERKELSAVLAERELGASGLANTRFRGSDRSLVEADLVLDCQIVEREKTVSIFAKAISVSNGRVETTVEVHGADKSPETMTSMADGLALKLEAEYPAVEGEIFKASPQFLSTLSKESKTRDGMRALAFRKGEEVILPGGKSVGSETYDIGPMLVRRVMPEYSVVEPDGEMYEQPIVGDVVVVR